MPAISLNDPKLLEAFYKAFGLEAPEVSQEVDSLTKLFSSGLSVRTIHPDGSVEDEKVF